MKAWEKLWEKTHEKIKEHALIRDRRYGAEAVSRAFLVAQCRIDGYRGEGTFAGWIWGIVKLQLKKIYAENERNRRLKERMAASYVYDGQDNPLDIVIRKERNNCIWRAFGALSDRQQMLVECCVLGKMGIKAASARTGVHWTEGKREYNHALEIMKLRFVCLYSGRKLL